MPTGQYNHPLFGLVKFKTKASTWTYGGEIVFTDGFDSADVINVTVPQLKGVKGVTGGKVKFHKRGKAQLLAAFEDIERLGLLKHITSSAGAFYQRLRKPIPKPGKPKVISKLPSNHSFGIAVDLNHDDGCNGCTTAPLADVFKLHGFHWGKSFNDPMHYEIEKFIDNDEPTVKDVKVKIAGKSVDLGAKAIFGDLFVAADKVTSIPNMKVKKSKGALSLSGGGAKKSFKPMTLGDQAYLPLPQVLGTANLTLEYDNDKKLAVAKPAMA